jgi:hypothetical protein
MNNNTTIHSNNNINININNSNNNKIGVNNIMAQTIILAQIPIILTIVIKIVSIII